MTHDKSDPSMDQQILREVKRMSKILTLANAPALERELSKYASSEERKRIWTSIDGRRKPSEIAKELGLGIRTVETFVKVLTQAELVESRAFGEPPRRLVDFVPASWAELIANKAADNKIQTTTSVPNSPLAESANGGNTNG
ncbi:MAG: hypothetical protein ACREBU_01885 [Nitrososphaera sp.]